MGEKVSTITRGLSDLLHDNLENSQYLDQFSREIEHLSKLLEKKNVSNLKFEKQNYAIRPYVLTTALERDIRKEIAENKRRWSLVYQDAGLVPDFEQHSWKRPMEGELDSAKAPKLKPTQSPKKRTWVKGRSPKDYHINKAKLKTEGLGIQEDQQIAVRGVPTEEKLQNQTVERFTVDNKENQTTLECKREVKPEMTENDKPSSGKSEILRLKETSHELVMQRRDSGLVLNLATFLPEQIAQPDQDYRETTEKKYSSSTYKPNTDYNRSPAGLRGSSIIKTPKEDHAHFWK